MLLEVQHIRKAFPNGTRALNDVSFSVDAGEFVSVIGPSGAGKTTLFRILNGALLCDAGEILVSGVHFEAAGRRQRRTIQAKIPAGIDNGQTISIRGQGHAGKNGGPSGDLLITITVRPHKLFRREGTSVLCEAPITFAQACLGAELEIPTIDGKVKYELPEGTQSGTTFRLKGKGIPELNGRGRGDQYVTVYIETPRNLNREQKEALKKFAESVGDNNYEERRKFFKKFKK